MHHNHSHSYYTTVKMTFTAENISTIKITLTVVLMCKMKMVNSYLRHNIYKQIKMNILRMTFNYCYYDKHQI
jgi:hypothetical protein